VPIIEIVLRQLRWYGVHEVVLSVGYLAELIRAYFTTRPPIPGLEISYLYENEPLGTAGALGLLGGVDDNLLVMNGDVLTNLDFGQMMELHLKEKPALTIAVHPRSVKIDLGVLKVDGGHNIVGYDEKPSLAYLCSMGIYCYSRRALEAIDYNERLDFPELVLRMLARGERVLAHDPECFWLDIGRHDDYARAVEAFDRLRPSFLPDEITPEASAASVEVIDLGVGAGV
jgi:NDP-sugar pyrophosphorylase family protein